SRWRLGKEHRPRRLPGRHHVKTMSHGTEPLARPRKSRVRETRMERVNARGGLAAAAVLGLILLAAGTAWAQVQAAGGVPGQRRPGGRVVRNPMPEARADEDLSVDGVFLPPDRTSRRRLETAQQMLEEGRFGEAVRLLGSLLESPEDYFFKPKPDQ